MTDVYEGSEKHKRPWQRGRRGSLCPPGLDGVQAQGLLDAGLASGSKRYASDGERAFCAQEHRDGHWHGYPVGWTEVPATVRRALIDRHRIPARLIRRYWSGDT